MSCCIIRAAFRLWGGMLLQEQSFFPVSDWPCWSTASWPKWQCPLIESGLHLVLSSLLDLMFHSALQKLKRGRMRLAVLLNRLQLKYPHRKALLQYVTQQWALQGLLLLLPPMPVSPKVWVCCSSLKLGQCWAQQKTWLRSTWWAGVSV